MSELIDRQAVIDVIEDYPHGNVWNVESMEEMVDKIKALPSAQPDLDEWCTDCREYDKDRHSCPRWNRVIRQTVEDMKAAQPEPQEGYWIKHETPDGGEQYECSRCGVLWEFTDGTPEDNEAYFCPKCGKKMKGGEHETD